MRLLLSLFLIPDVFCSRILVYSPSISTSHVIMNGRIADTLVKAGHEVVMFIPEYDPSTSKFNGTKLAKIIRMNDIGSWFAEDLVEFLGPVLANDRLGFSERLDYEYILTAMCEGIMERKDELDILKEYKFDVAFTEQIDFCGFGVLRYLGIENILWVSSTPLMDAVSYNLGVPSPVSYVPTIEENDNNDVMNFWQRAFNLYMYIGTIVIHRIATDMSTEVFRKHVDPSFPNLREIAANTSLCFVTADEMFDLPRPILQKTIYVGGLGIEEASPLTPEFASIMSKGERGVIIFSLGSVAQFSLFAPHVRTHIVNVVRKMPEYHFIFKISKRDNSSVDFFNGVPNVDLTTWLPQSDIMAHPRLSLFIMHGGINGLTEALLRAVPLVVIPVFIDQFRNGRNVERRGIGKVVLKRDLDEKNLLEAIQTVLGDDSYKQNAVRMQKLMREKPFSPAERLVKWTEFAANHGVLDNLHVQGSRMNSIVYFNLDVFAAIFVMFFFVVYSFYKLVRVLCDRKYSAEKLKSN